jgi:uncharacterized membrane protein
MPHVNAHINAHVYVCTSARYAVAVQSARRACLMRRFSAVPQIYRLGLMLSSNPRSTESLAGRPLHVMLVAIPIVCFGATLVTDIVYSRTAEVLWADMSAWLLLVGLLFAVLAAIAGLIDFFGEPRIRQLRAAWIHVIGNIAVIILAFFNELIHTRDAYTSVVPAGLVLSALTVLILLTTGWNGWSMVYRHRVGVREGDRT